MTLSGMVLPLPCGVALLARGPGALRPDPARAHDWLERELERPAYHQSLLQRLAAWLDDLWSRATHGAQGASSLSAAVTVGLIVLLVVVVALLVARVRLEPRRTAAGAPVLSAQGVSPDQHRSAAEAALAGGEVDRALVEAFRALASRAVTRALVLGRPGLTARELVADLAPRFPDRAVVLATAADRFDRVFYGRQGATAADARSVLDLDDALRRDRPDAAPRSMAPTTTTAPR